MVRPRVTPTPPPSWVPGKTRNERNFPIYARFDGCHREHWARSAQLASNSFASQSRVQLEQWLNLVVPILRELADASLRNRTELSNGIVAICDLLDWDVHRDVQLAADDAHHQVDQLAAAAGIHYVAWSELHQLLQTHIQNQLKRPDRSRHVPISRN